MADVTKISVENASTIADIFMKMSYGPVSDSYSFAKAWLSDIKLGPFIGGVYKETSGVDIEVYEGCTNQVITTVGASSLEDINEAVNTSLKAADAWSKLSPHQRARHLYSLARHLQKHGTTLAQMESLNRGVQSRDPRDFDVPAMVRSFYYYAGWAQLLSSSELASWKPLGVVAGVLSSSSPLAMLGMIVAPALAAGNTVCLKPSQRTPLTALLFASIASQAGLPAGVINVLPGDADVAKMLATHSQVSKVTFSGSAAVGRLIREETAGLGQRLTFLLNGGRSSTLVFDSADLDSAVEGAVDAAWFNQGQVPWAMGKLLIQESVWDDFISRLQTSIQKLRIGPAFDHLADVGKPVDKTVISNLSDAIAQAKMRGLEVYQKQLPSNLSSDEFFPPTLVIGDVPYSNNTVDEDVQLPLIAAIPFRTAKEAIALANNSRYGLAASVWTENASLALEVASQLQVGTVWLNSHGALDAGIPFAGRKMSGEGVLGGKEGLLECMQYSGVRANMLLEPINYETFGTSPYAPDCYPVPQTGSNLELHVDCTYKLYYGGAHKRPDSNLSRTVADGKGKPYAAVPEGSRKDIRNAVEAAIKALPAWWKLGEHGRAQILYNCAEKLQLRREDFVSRLTILYGNADEDAAAREVDASLELLFLWAASCDKKQMLAGDVTSNGCAVHVTREPLGVIGIVQAPVPSPPGPWALLSFIALFAPAVCFGNSVVLLADNVHPTPAIEFCQVIDTSDFPAGVVNVLSGDTDRMLVTLAGHQEVSALWAPGVAPATAKYIEWAAMTNLKHTWVDKLPCFDSLEQSTGCRELFELHATQVKATWIPYGEIFSN